MVIKCIQCGKEFEISEEEEKFYTEKGFSIPKRCKDCRERDKQGKRAGSMHQERYTWTESERKTVRSVKVWILVIIIALLVFFCVRLMQPGDGNKGTKESNAQPVISVSMSKEEIVRYKCEQQNDMLKTGSEQKARKARV